MLSFDDLGDVGVEFGDVDDFAGVFGFDVGRHRQVVVVGGDVLVRDQCCDVFLILAISEEFEDAGLVVFGDLVLVAVAGELCRGVDEQDSVVGFGLLDHDDAGGDRGAEEQVRWQLDHGVDVVVVDEVLADLAFCTTPVQHAGELDDRRGTVDRQPRQDVHRECEVSLRLRGEHTGRCEAGVVDQQRVGITVPLDGVGRVGHDRFERLIIPVRRVDEGVAVGEVELLVVDVVQEHVDAGEVVSGQVDFLAVEPLTHIAFTKDLVELQQQGPGTDSRVVDLVDLFFADDGDAGEKFGDFLGGVVLATGLACTGGVHLHEVLIGVAEQVDGVVFEVAQREVTDRVEEFGELFVALGDGVAELGTVDVEVIEQAFEIVLGVGAECGAFDVLEHTSKDLVEVRVVRGVLADVVEQFRRQDVEAFFFDCLCAPELGFGVGELCVVEVCVAGLVFAVVDVGGEVFGDEPVEEHAQDVGLEVPAVDGAAEVVGDAPDRLVEFGALVFFAVRCHVVASPVLRGALFRCGLGLTYCRAPASCGCLL